MREKSTIRFEIPVPWGSRPICVHASGSHAVTTAAVAVILLALIGAVLF